MKLSTPRKLTALAITTSIVALGSTAHAQYFDEVITTAQKKEQNLQDVPIAITSFDLEGLETNRIEGLEDIGKVVPGIYVTQNPADPNGVRISIRGIGTFDPQVGQDSRVAIYQDGIYLGKTQGLGFDMPDLARVEVLKGPQGTLYGRNTVAGAINLISATPDPSGYSGKVNAEYGNYNHTKISGALNVPMGDSAAVRLSGLYLDRDGWVENTGPGTDFGGEKKFGVRGAFGIEFSDEVRLDMSADYNKVEKEPLFYQSFGAPGPVFSAAITPFDNGRQETAATSFTNEAGDLETKGVSLTGTWTPVENHEVKVTAGYREVDSSRLVALVPTANPAILNAITGGFNQALAPLPFTFGATQAVQGLSTRPDFASAFSGTPAERGLFLSPPGGSANLPGHNQLSLELTYNGEFADGAVEYTGGMFYFDEETGTGPGVPNPANANDYLFVLGGFSPQVTPLSTHQFFGTQIGPSITDTLIPGYTPQSQAITCLTGTSNNACFSPIVSGLTLLNFLQNPFFGQQAFGQLQAVNGFNNAFLSSARQSASNTLQIDTKAFAIYGQATWHVSDDLRITGGLRYSDESKDGVGQAKSPFFNDNIDLMGNLILPNIASFDDEVLDPSLTVEFDASDDVMLYASYKESFRSGGFNNSAVALRMPGLTYGADFTFDREDITAYEAGFKGDFGDRVRINAAGFYYDFKNKQTTFALNPIIATERAVVNTNDEIYGFEIDGQFALSEDLTLRGAYTFIDGEAGDTVNPNNPNDIRMFDELQGTPKNSFMAAVDYNSSNGVFGNLTYSYKDDVLSIPESNLRLPSFGLVNGRIGYTFPTSKGHDVTVSLWGTNLLDEEYLIDSLPFGTFAYETKVYGQPRSYGASAGLRF